VWLFTALAHHYHICQWVGTFDPRLGGAVVTSRHSPSAPAVGTVVEIPKTVAA
jgi:CRISPR-associated Csx3 family protein